MKKIVSEILDILATASHATGIDKVRVDTLRAKLAAVTETAAAVKPAKK